MYYIYRITNKINGKTYIGQHKYKKLNDNYTGSGKLIRRAQSHIKDKHLGTKENLRGTKENIGNLLIENEFIIKEI